MRDAYLSNAEPEYGGDARRKQSTSPFHDACSNHHAETTDRGFPRKDMLLRFNRERVISTTKPHVIVSITGLLLFGGCDADTILLFPPVLWCSGRMQSKQGQHQLGCQSGRGLGESRRDRQLRVLCRSRQHPEGGRNSHDVGLIRLQDGPG